MSKKMKRELKDIDKSLDFLQDAEKHLGSKLDNLKLRLQQQRVDTAAGIGKKSKKR